MRHQKQLSVEEKLYILTNHHHLSVTDIRFLEGCSIRSAKEKMDICHADVRKSGKEPLVGSGQRPSLISVEVYLKYAPFTLDGLVQQYQIYRQLEGRADVHSNARE